MLEIVSQQLQLVQLIASQFRDGVLQWVNVLGLGDLRVSTFRLSLDTAGFTYSQILPTSVLVWMTTSHSSQLWGPARIIVVRCTLEDDDIVSAYLVWYCTDLLK